MALCFIISLSWAKMQFEQMTFQPVADDGEGFSWSEVSVVRACDNMVEPGQQTDKQGN